VLLAASALTFKLGLADLPYAGAVDGAIAVPVGKRQVGRGRSCGLLEAWLPLVAGTVRAGWKA